MESPILANATRLLLPVLLLFAVLFFLRGHNAPGGGFAGGLVVAAAVALFVIGSGLQASRHLLPVRPPTMMGLGLVVAAATVVVPMLAGHPPMKGLWLPFQIPVMPGFYLGTPVLFDLGVFMVAGGSLLQVLVTLEEEQ